MGIQYTMARGRRGSPARSRAPPAAAPPAPQQSSGGGMLSGIGSTIAQGMAFGTGSAIAHQAVGAVVGSMSGGGSNAAASEPITGAPVEQVQQQQLDNTCIDEKKMFYDCVNVNKGDQQACTFMMDMVKDCQRNQQQMYS